MNESIDKMTLSKILFSFEGRINRAKFWGYSLALAPIWAIGMALDFSTTGDFGSFYLLAVAICFVPSLALNVKRCHDRNKSGWFYLVAFIPLIGPWYLIEAGFLRGTDGSNKYGADPLTRPDNSL